MALDEIDENDRRGALLVAAASHEGDLATEGGAIDRIGGTVSGLADRLSLHRADATSGA
ncbi:MAG: hypothetical protein ACRDZ2_10880 [Ilumatobacteraceae bacterium]